VIRMDDYSQMTEQELRSARVRVADDLADFEEMAVFHSIHSPAHATSTERKTASGRSERMKNAIAEIDRLLAVAATE